MKKTVCCLLAVLTLGLPSLSTDRTLPSVEPPAAARCQSAGLEVRALSPDGTVSIGSYVELEVTRDGEVLSYMDFTCGIVDGLDCAAVYYNANLLGLGEGSVTVKVWLDDDPSVCGFGTVRVVRPSAPNRYTRENELLPVECFEASDPEFEASLSGFPESYKPYLRALHSKYPSWVFLPFETGLRFDDAVGAESVADRNVTLLANVADIFKSKDEGDYDRETESYILKDTGWVETNGIAVSFYMDPRNYLDERAVFQFELLTFDPAFHTEQGVEGILAGSFMSNAHADYLDADGGTVKCDRTYAEIIMSAAEQTGVNPYYLAAKIRGEIGSSSPSDSANGRCPGYEGYYNFYNIGATDGEGNIERALDWASSGTSYGKPWTSPELAIIGGAMFLSESYVGTGQFTGYLQKFNVNPDSEYELYHHQYMTNVSGAVSQAMSTYSGYAELGLLDSPIVFSIPVYLDMPEPYYQTGGVSFSPTLAAVTDSCELRSGPAAFYPPVVSEPLPEGAVVKVVSSCMSAYDLYHSFLFYPYWYKVELLNDEKTMTGYLCAEFVELSSLALPVGSTLSLPVSFDGEGLKILSDNTAVAEVSEDGAVVGLSPGKARVTAYTSGGAFVSYTVTVY